MSRADDFNKVTKGVPVRVLERAFNFLTPGIDWRGSGRPALRDFYTGTHFLGKNGLGISAESVKLSIAAEQSTLVAERSRLLALIDSNKPSHICSFVAKDGQLWVQKGTNEVMIWIANLEKTGEQQD